MLMHNMLGAKCDDAEVLWQLRVYLSIDEL